MPIELQAPGGTVGGPLAMTRKFGVSISLTKENFPGLFQEGKNILPQDWIEEIGEALKQEWIHCMREKLAGVAISFPNDKS